MIGLLQTPGSLYQSRQNGGENYYSGVTEIQRASYRYLSAISSTDELQATLSHTVMARIDMGMLT